MMQKYQADDSPGYKDPQAFVRYVDANHKRLSEIDEASRKAGTLLYRVVRHPYADGYATYQVVREGKKTVTIEICTGLGDDWVLPAWGRRATVPRSTIADMIQREDKFRKAFTR